VDVQLHAFLTLSLYRSEWPALRSDPFAPWQRDVCPFYTKLGGPQSRSESCSEEKKTLTLLGKKKKTWSSSQ